MRNSNSDQLSLVLPHDINVRVRRDAARRGLSVAAYIRVVLATAQSGGDVSTFFSLPSPPPLPVEHQEQERHQAWQ